MVAERPKNLLPMKECHHYEPGDPTACANDLCPDKKKCEALRQKEKDER